MDEVLKILKGIEDDGWNIVKIEKVQIPIDSVGLLKCMQRPPSSDGLLKCTQRPPSSDSVTKNLDSSPWTITNSLSDLSFFSLFWYILSIINFIKILDHSF